LGHLGIQFAAALGSSSVYAISQTASKEADAKKMGATHYVNMSDPESVKSAAGSMDLIVCTANYDNMSLTQYMALLKMKGKLVMVGAPETDISVSAFMLLMVNTLFILYMFFACHKHIIF
jgi:D-arabinose 1-dehydrogenase-like Zn-dependent alcohol dehydrogenase